MAPVVLRTRILWLLCLGPPPGPYCPLSHTSTQPHTHTVLSPHPTTSSRPTPMAEAVPVASTARGAGAVGRLGAMGGRGARGGLRIGPLSPSPAVAVSLSLPAGAAAFDGVGNLVGLVMGALPHPGAHQGVLPISEPTRGCIPMAHLLVWPSLITP